MQVNEYLLYLSIKTCYEVDVVCGNEVTCVFIVSLSLNCLSIYKLKSGPGLLATLRRTKTMQVVIYLCKLIFVNYV